MRPIFAWLTVATTLSCNDAVEEWSIINKRPNATPTVCRLHKKNFDGMLYGATELDIAPNKMIRYTLTAYGGTIDLHDVEITAWLDADGKPFPAACEKDIVECAPAPEDPVVIVKKKGPPWVFNIVFE